jgi:pantoate--beta-alanine ligase
VRTVTRIAELRAAVEAARANGRRIGFVPTMGFLHEGHLALVDEARRRCDFVVMSIFVNPLQFGPSEDFTRYPRDADGDASKAAGRSVDLLFLPATDEMYPRPPRVEVTPGKLANRWEGAVRPGHFAGVLTVVAKLFHMVDPEVAVFGQKDIQQVILVRAMVRDLDWPVEIVLAPTVREPDGLALSSRNSYLDPAERRRAVVLSRALRRMHALWRDEREVGADRLLAAGRSALGEEPGVVVDYLALADGDTLEPVESVRAGTVAMVAARVGRTRLIDNLIFADG